MVRALKIKGISRKMNKLIGAAVIGAAFSTTGFAAPLLFDQNVMPDVIFGSGNSNGSFTVDRNNGVELGLRAKIPFVGTTHSNGDGTYSYTIAETAAAPGPFNAWNFDWTVNTNYDGSTDSNISALTYRLGIDFDPGLGTDFFEFDPITPTIAPLFAPFYDHSIGDNSTANGGGVEAGDGVTYQNLIDNNNVLQQSWRHAFFTTPSGKSYDPTVSGTYDIFLSAFDANGGPVARTDIQVFIGDVPEPAPFALFGLSLVAMALYRRKKSQ